MKKEFVSPRSRMVESVKTYMGSSYSKMFLQLGSKELAELKIKAIGYALFKMLDNYYDDISTRNRYGKLDIVHGITVLSSYDETILSEISNENKLGLFLFIEWGNLTSKLEKVSYAQQNMLVAL